MEVYKILYKYSVAFMEKNKREKYKYRVSCSLLGFFFLNSSSVCKEEVAEALKTDRTTMEADDDDDDDAWHFLFLDWLVH